MEDRLIKNPDEEDFIKMKENHRYHVHLKGEIYEGNLKRVDLEDRLLILGSGFIFPIGTHFNEYYIDFDCIKMFHEIPKIVGGGGIPSSYINRYREKDLK